MKLLEKHTDVNSEIYQSMLAEQRKLQDKALTAVREAIKIFLSDTDSVIENIYIERTPNLSMKVVKNGTHFSIEQLSYGEKSLFAMVGDIARRLTLLNPTLDNPLEGKGIILIDEPDVHLHPQWQRHLISLLDKTFPNCQFILTTHSPLLISDHKDILVYSIEKGQVKKINSLYGQDINSVLSEIMDTDFINQKVQNQLGDILDAINEGNIKKAKDWLSKLEKEISANNIELVKARLLLKKKEVQLEKNQQKKGYEPPSLTQWKKQNKNKKYIDLTPNLRAEIRAKLLKEQFYLCGHCCQQIPNIQDCHNEHIEPQQIAHQRTLDYSNIIVSCNSKK